MTATTYFNELDPFAAKWLGNLYPAAEIDCRDIHSVSGSDLEGHKRVHLFAGIGGWEYALKLARWPERKAVWTGSCPCQPFSDAGKRRGINDPHHLWPEFLRLVEECNPSTIFGEQVASKAGREWLSGVFADLEALGYAVAGADLCAASVAAPHIRQRLFWVAIAERSSYFRTVRLESEPRRWERPVGQNVPSRVVDTDHPRSQRRNGGSLARVVGEARDSQPAGSSGGASDWLADSIGQPVRNARPGAIAQAKGRLQRAHEEWQRIRPDPWQCADLIRCSDGAVRRVPSADPESGLFPLADGTTGRVGRLRAYGNAIVPQLAAQFIRAVMDAT